MYIKSTVVALALLFTTSCKDPNEPARYVDVPTPEWTKTVKVVSVSKNSARVENSLGQSFTVAYSGTDIGNGLTATRSRRNLYIEDRNGVKCNWNTAERLVSSRKVNPAYEAYKANQPR